MFVTPGQNRGKRLLICLTKWEFNMNGLRWILGLIGVKDMMKVIKKPPQLDAIQWKGNNREQLEKLMHYLVPGRFIIEDLDIGDWIVVHENGMYEVVSDKEFDVTFERV